MNIEKVKKIDYPIYEMDDNGSLILPMDIINQIMYLHSTVGKTEWSGILLYDVIKGNISDPKNFVLKAKHIFLMDIGNTAYTEYETDGDIVDIYDNIEGAMNMKLGHVHSHHDMSAFFSGTDTSELMENVDKHNYYLSLIVNFEGKYVAKVAFLSEIKNTSWMNFVNDHGKLQKFKKDTFEKTMVVMNMDIKLEYNDAFFYNRITQVYTKKENAKIKADAITAANRQKYTQPNDFQLSLYRDWDNYHNNPNSTLTKINDASSRDPLKLSNSDVDSLTRNILAINTELSETRSVYTLLFTLAEGKEEDYNYYYDFLDDNIGNILGEFFQNYMLTPEEVKVVMKEVIMSINRYYSVKKLKTLVKNITNLLTIYGETIKEEEDEITKMIESYG